MNHLPQNSLVSIELSKLVDLLYRASIRLPKDQILVDHSIYQAITNAKDFQLVCHFEPLTDEDIQELGSLGFSHHAKDNVWQLWKLDAWKKVYEYEVARKQEQDQQRQRALEFKDFARTKLKRAQLKLIQERGMSRELANQFLNIMLSSELKSKGEFDYFIETFDLGELRGKITSVESLL